MKLKEQRKMEESSYVSFDSLDIDAITLPSLPSRTPSELDEWSKSDEILLDPEDRPLDLAVNANSPVTFNLVAGPDRAAEVLASLQNDGFTSSQRRKLMEKFNLDDDMTSSLSDFGGARTSRSSASESTGVTDSLDGSPTLADRRRARFGPSVPHAKSQKQQQQRSDLKKVQHLQNRDARSAEKPHVLSISTMPRSRDAKSAAKQARRPQGPSQRQGREQSGVSASARRLFSSLRKNTRGRSASRERADRQASAKAVAPPAQQDDLSADVHLPGILKIFGDVVSPGAKYKSVLATRQSKARELVKTALERYGVSRSLGRQYVLCEVVGRLRAEKEPETALKQGRVGRSVQIWHQGNSNGNERDALDEAFVEDYVRPLNDHEKPLILQSYWKPLEGYARRFELRNRSQVLDQINSEKDRETKDVNAQAKRLIIKNSRISRKKSSLNIKMAAPEYSSSEDDEETYACIQDITKASKDEINNNLELATPPTPPQFADRVQGEAANGTEPEASGGPVPFLLTLQGEEGVSSGSENERGGSLVHHLDTKVTVIGRDQSEPLKDGSSPIGSADEVSIKLVGDDIKPHHCVIYRIKEDEEQNHSASSPWKVTLHLVADDCDVTVNGQAVASDKEIANGDVIAIGAKYIFMLKDPTSKANLNGGMRLAGLNSNAGRLSNSIASRGSAFTPVKKRYVEMEVNYRPEYEEHVLDVVFAAANDIVSASSSRVRSENCDRELAPARFLMHCVEQSCFNFTSEQKRSLLFVIATNLQTILLDATGSVSMQDDSKIKNPEEGINYILPKLEDVVFWMSNSLEIFSYLQTDLVERVQSRVAKEVELGEVDQNLLNDASSFRVTDDVLAVLEEIVMYAFQQLVYYLTKTLYGALPKVLDANPFAEVNENGAAHGTGHVTAIYDAALGLTRKYGVHPEIERQLFAYLFFFTNVSLFNTLMEDEASTKYYRWEKGVQIRGNLEEIECWANDNDFQDQATQFLDKFSALTNLLATTKTQMLQNSWSQFRRDFPQLNPAQLRQVLDGYVLGPRVRKRPAEWLPDAEDLEKSTEEDDMLESYDNHPPLVLPTGGSQIALDDAPTGAWYSALRDVLLAVGQGREVETSIHDVWRTNSNNNSNNSMVGERQQPDGHEIPIGHPFHSPVLFTAASSVANRHAGPRHAPGSEKMTHAQSADAAARPNDPPHSPSSTSLSSMLSDSTSHTSADRSTRERLPFVRRSSAEDAAYRQSPTPAPRRPDVPPTPSPRAPRGYGSNAPAKYATLDRPGRKNRDRSKQVLADDQPCDYSSLLSDDRRVSLTQETQTLRQQRNSATTPEDDATRAMPSEVFIVDVVKGRKGLGLGLVDGMFTSLQVPGVFVRSLVPDGPSVKRVRMKHQEVIKCWLQDGRLLLGDRILAVNGTSLVSMNYASAMEELRLAGDRMRFLVGRSGSDVAMKITTSSC